MTLQEEMLAQLARRVITIENDVRRQTCEIREIKASLADMPNRRWLATWSAVVVCFLGLVVFSAASVLQ